MRGNRILMVLIGFALLSAIMVIPASAEFEPGECDIYVYSGQSIDNAVNNATDGQTVCVYNGTYGGRIDFEGDPRITLKGEGADVVTWDGGSEDKIVIGDNAAETYGTILEGFTIKGAVAGSDFVKPCAPDCIIRNCVFAGLTFDTGIQLAGNNTTFMNNVVSNATGEYCAIGIVSDNCTIINSTFRDNVGAAISLEGSSCVNSIVTKNNIISNAYAGIELYNAGEGNKIYLNNFVDNGVTATTTGTTAPAVTYWNSTEQIEYTYGGETGECYMGNYWDVHSDGESAECPGIWDTSYTVPDGLGEDYRPLMTGFENYLGEAPEPEIGCEAEDGTVYKCGETVMQSCTLNGDMECPCPTETGLKAGNPDITIEGYNETDGEYYSIKGEDACEWCNRTGIYNEGYDNVTITNVTISGFCNGIKLKGSGSGEPFVCSDNVEKNMIYNCTVYNNTGGDCCCNGIYLSPCVCNGTIDNCEIYDNSGKKEGACTDCGAGINLFGKSNKNTITNNDIHGNHLAGIYAKKACMNNYVADNDVYENGEASFADNWLGGGIRMQCMMTNKWTVEDNNVTDNYGPGIYVRGNNNVIRNNNVSGSRNVAGATGAASFGDGILLVDIANNNNVTANKFCFNEHADVCDDKGTTNYGDGNRCDTRCSGDSGSITCCDRCTTIPATVYLEPEDSSAAHCNEVAVEIWANTSDPYLSGGTVNLTYDAGCANVTNFVNTSAWEKGEWNSNTDGKEWITFASNITKTGEVLIGTLTIHCVNESQENCTTGLVFDEGSMLVSKPPGEPSVEIETAWEDGGFACANVPVPEKPDLVIVEKTEDWVSLADKTYNVTYTVKNAGDAEAGASNTTITIDDVDVPEDPVPGLAAGTSYTNTVGPFTMSGASDTIKVCADNGEVVAESDETNNCMENVFAMPGEYIIKIGNYSIYLFNGGEVTVPVEIWDATDVEGGEANVTFNASVVGAKAVSAGNFGTPEANIDNTNGFVHIAASSATAAGVDPAVLAYVVFEGLAEGETDLEIDDAYVSFDAGNISIPAATEDGHITVETLMLGDLNHNDRVDTGDATLVLRMVVGLTPVDMLGDMNHNGRIDTGDATIILRIIVGLPV